MAAWYAGGVIKAWRAAGIDRGVRVREAMMFTAGWCALVVALIGLHELSEELFAAHMVQHELLMVVAAPLIAASAPIVAALWLLPIRTRRQWPAVVRQWRRSSLAWIATPGASFILHALALWIWHLPRLFEAAARHEALHAAQHLSFFATGVLFWWTILRDRTAASSGAGIIYIFGTAMQSGLLGALLLFSQRLWYTGASSPTSFVAALEDQQLAGAVMWIPAGVIFTVAGLWFLARWLKESRRLVERRHVTGSSWKVSH